MDLSTVGAMDAGASTHDEAGGLKTGLGRRSPCLAAKPIRLVGVRVESSPAGSQACRAWLARFGRRRGDDAGHHSRVSNRTGASCGKVNDAKSKTWSAVRNSRKALQGIGAVRHVDLADVALDINC